MTTIIDLESHRAARRRKEFESAEDTVFNALEMELAAVVTKEELAEVRSELKGELALMESRVSDFEARVSAEMKAMRRRLLRIECLVAVRTAGYMVSGAISALIGVWLAGAV